MRQMGAKVVCQLHAAVQCVCGGFSFVNHGNSRFPETPLGMKLLSKTSWVLSLWLIPPGASRFLGFQRPTGVPLGLGLCVWSFLPGTRPFWDPSLWKLLTASAAARKGTSKGQHVGEAAPCFVWRACGFCGAHAGTQGGEGWDSGKQAAQELGAREWLQRRTGEERCGREMWRGLGRRKGEKRLCWWGQRGGLAPCLTLRGFCREALALLDAWHQAAGRLWATIPWGLFYPFIHACMHSFLYSSNSSLLNHRVWKSGLRKNSAVRLPVLNPGCVPRFNFLVLKCLHVGGGYDNSTYLRRWL